MTIPEIQDFVKTNRTPCLCFNPPANDPQNAVRYQNFVTSLQNRGSVRTQSPEWALLTFRWLSFAWEDRTRELYFLHPHMDRTLASAPFA